MSDYHILLDVAKAHQAFLASEVEHTRADHNPKRGRKTLKLSQRLRRFLSNQS
jgi:hypothetical protein